MTQVDTTHDPTLRSWVESADDPATDFPIQNLPFGVFRRAEGTGSVRVGVAIGDQILDVVAARDAGLLSGDASLPAAACGRGALNDLMGLGPRSARALRRGISLLLRVESADGGTVPERVKRNVLVPMSDAVMDLPVEVPDYTDFYASIDHATNVGRLFRPDNPLLPNYKHLPIGYHARASSLVVSGRDVCRPSGQRRSDGAGGFPVFGPTARLDYEAEMGFLIGVGNTLGSPIRIDDAERHVFGCCLVNDWSARDIQMWEYQPLGPFLGKSFATTVSPWVVTLDALAPFRTSAFPRPRDDPEPLPYLTSAENAMRGGIAIAIEVFLSSARMRAHEVEPRLVSRGTVGGMYWTFAQLVTHHASNGCNLRSGDLLASGTISGPTPESWGSLIERTSGGSAPLPLPNGESRTFLEDGDEVVMRAYCERSGYARIGFGECRGRIVPALPA